MNNNSNNYYQNPQSNQGKNQNYNQGYSSSGRSRKPLNNYENKYNKNKNINQSNFQKQQNMPMPYSDNIRNTEAPHMFNNPLNQEQNNQISRMTEFKKGKERPLWSYREIKYDEFRQPRNTEIVTTTSIPRKSNLVEQPEPIPRKSNLEELQEQDKKYFNNVKYKKVKVTKKVKNEEKNQRKGPEDDFEQKYSLQNDNVKINDYNNNQYNDNNDNNYIIGEHQIEEDKKLKELNDEINPNLINEDIEGNNNALNNNNLENDEDFEYILNNNNNNNNNNDNLEEKDTLNYENPKNDDNDGLDKENYVLDLDTLEEAHSVKNQQEEIEEEEYNPNQLKYNNEIDDNLENINNDTDNNNNYLNNNNLNNQINPRPSFFETTTQKVNDNINQINNIAEANLEKWNLVADYTP